mmetsp:Transcript_28381/g.42439  ORF Transcript_28381/g.42439 Transcript_28381/m.42439 type:complete len:114 (-) Transcript_28381:1404-1745(-)
MPTEERERREHRWRSIKLCRQRRERGESIGVILSLQRKRSQPSNASLTAPLRLRHADRAAHPPRHSPEPPSAAPPLRQPHHVPMRAPLAAVRVSKPGAVCIHTAAPQRQTPPI